MNNDKNTGYLAFALKATWPLLRTILCIFAVGVIGLLSLRQHGLSRQYTGPIHQLFQTEFVVAAEHGGAADAPANTQAAFDQAVAISPQLWLHVDIRRCADNLVAFQDERLEHTTDGQGPIIEQNAAQLAQLDAGYQFGPQEHFPFRGQHLKILTLDQVLERYPSTAFILDIHSNTIDIHKQVIEAVERHQADQRVLIQSDHDVILSSIKELRPMWLFGTGTRDLTRSHLLTSVFLASMAPLLGDVLIAPMQIRGHDVVQEDLIREVHRRHKKFFVSDVDDPNTLTHLRQLGVDGVISNRPAAIWPLFKQNL